MSSVVRAPPKKMQKVAEEDCRKIILDYMAHQNRPYNAQNIFDNLHGSIPKGILLKCLDTLADSNELQCKVYGKLKVYLISQGDAQKENHDEHSDSHTSVETEFEQLSRELNDLKKTYNNRLFPELTISQLKEQLQTARDIENSHMAAENNITTKTASESEIATLKAKQKLWKTYKNDCMEKVDMLAHAMNLDVKTVCEDILDLDLSD